jgi:hypothetical protein
MRFQRMANAEKIALWQGAETERMARQDGTGTCEHCKHSFGYCLIHNGFNDSAYAYCDQCGQTALLNGWKQPKSIAVTLKYQRAIEESAEHLLKSCPCGGTFKGAASPRCPNCREALSPVSATAWIEANAPGTKKGWHWQQNWQSIYCIVIDDRLVKDNWRET